MNMKPMNTISALNKSLFVCTAPIEAAQYIKTTLNITNFVRKVKLATSKQNIFHGDLSAL